jgi:hypothetical protein
LPAKIVCDINIAKLRAFYFEGNLVIVLNVENKNGKQIPITVIEQ